MALFRTLMFFSQEGKWNNENWEKMTQKTIA
jgi:hypothetical protein